MKLNPLTAIDFYKADHRRQYPEGTNFVYSNFTPRSGRLSNLPENDHIIFFGLQYFVKDFLQDSWNKEFFQKDKVEVVAKYKRRMDTSLGPDAIPVDHIEALHDLGYLPLEIRALPEGARVPYGVPVLTVHNTHPDFFWLVNYIETIMSCYLWKMCTSATTANWYREFLTTAAMQTVGNADFVPFQAHDFSYRGLSGPQDAMMSGAGHLTSFVGTDTVSAIDFVEDYYNADADQELIGCSVPATEHSVMCMGTQDGEFETFKRLITELYPSGIVSIVSDTWDFWQVITDFLPRLKSEILARSGHPIANKVVIRPDSGDPVKIICGYNRCVEVTSLDDMSVFAAVEQYDCDVVKYNGKYYLAGTYGTDDDFVEISEAEFKGAVECMWDTFGGVVSDQGFKVLDEHIGLIYGDSITPQRCYEIINRLASKGFASTNVVFGVGSYTYQMVTRDTHGSAVKATYGEVNGVGRAIQKSPKTDSGIKKSHCGLLQVQDDNGTFIVNQGVTKEEAFEDSELLPVFTNGELVCEYTLNDIRNNVKLN